MSVQLGALSTSKATFSATLGQVDRPRGSACADSAEALPRQFDDLSRRNGTLVIDSRGEDEAEFAAHETCIRSSDIVFWR